MSAHLAADLAVTLDNDRPGALAKVLGCVSAAGINIDGYSEMNGIVHILAIDLAATRDCLHTAGFRELQKQEVVVVPVEDEPGAAAGVFQRIAEAHINVAPCSNGIASGRRTSECTGYVRYSAKAPW